MDAQNEKKISSSKIKLSPLKLNTLYTKNNFSEIKKEENTSKSYFNSLRYVTNFEESSFETKNLHIIKKPYKIFLPIRTKIKKIKNNRELSLNNYYKKTKKNELFLKDIMNTESLNSEIFKKRQDNISKNLAINSTERTTTTTRDLSIFNTSNISKANNYDKYKIFSSNKKKGILKNKNNNIYNNSSNIIKSYNDYRPLRFMNFNQGYKNLPSLKNCINNFTNGIKNLTREKYMNYCLKEKNNTAEDYREFKDDNYKIEILKKTDNKYLFDTFYKDYNNYYNLIKKKEEKDNDKISLLNWEIISYKNEVNRLNIKKDKLLARLNKYMKMKNFLITMRNYSIDIKDDSWMFEKKTQKDKNIKTLLQNIKIKQENTENESQEPITKENFARRGSVELKNISKLGDMKNKDNKNSSYTRRIKRLESASEDKNPLLGSAVKEISTILNNHIANLLIYQNQLRIDIEPLKEEFNNLYKSLKENDEKKSKLLKLQFLIFPEKKRIAKERNEFLNNTLINIKNHLCNSSKYYKLNKVIKEKLLVIYKTLLDNNIITLGRMKASLEGNVVEAIFFYLKNIEEGMNILISKEKKIKEEYPKAYNDIIKEINDEIKLKALEMQKKKDKNQGNKKSNEILNKMNRNYILNRRKDYYQYGYKKAKKKVKVKKIDPYDDLRYSDSNISNEEDEK